MKNTINVSFKNWFVGFDFKNIVLFNHKKILDSFDIVINDEHPDVIFFGTYGDFIGNACLNDDSIKVLIITEPISPDFIFFDYCLSFEPFDFGGRNCFYPDFIDQVDLNYHEPSHDEALKLYYSKSIFCDFIYSHETHNGLRKKYYDLFSEYRKVESAGTYLNNQKNKSAVNWDCGNNSKKVFQDMCRFSICIQELDWDYFINEKIVHSLQSNTIPIFYGPAKTKEIFNKNRFIFVNDYTDSELLNLIKQIDNDPNIFANYISQPIFSEKFDPKIILDNAATFIFDIFKNKIKRRNDLCKPSEIKRRLISQKAAYDKLNRLKHIFCLKGKRK